MRRMCLVLGLLALGAIWFGPLLTVWRESIAAHMLAHMGVVAVAAPLIALGLGNPLARIAASGGPMPIALPAIASLAEFAVVWGWHAPAARDLAENTLWGTALEQSSFLIAGLFLWFSCLSAGASNASAHRAAGAFGLLLTTVHMTLLGALLGLGPRPLYRAGEVTCFGTTLTAMQDQQFGAVIMLFVGAAVYLAGGVALLSRLLAPSAERAA